MLLDLVRLILLSTFINMAPGYWLGLTTLSVFMTLQKYAAPHKYLSSKIDLILPLKAPDIIYCFLDGLLI